MSRYWGDYRQLCPSVHIRHYTGIKRWVLVSTFKEKYLHPEMPIQKIYISWRWPWEVE